MYLPSNCDGVILPRAGDEIKGKEMEYCPRCDCRFESRNTTIIKVVVIMIMFVMTMLLVYWAFLMCLGGLAKKRVQHVSSAAEVASLLQNDGDFERLLMDSDSDDYQTNEYDDNEYEDCL